jgi:hypothetical protein
MRPLLTFVVGVALCGEVRAQPFDHDHAAWDALLHRHVRSLADGTQSRLDYDGLATDRAQLRAVLGTMSAVTRREFDAWSREQQMAFLINAYNAFTVELILTRWPRLTSINDIGSVLTNPWKKEFFRLLGPRRHLDWIEHAQLRPRYHEPRVHAALNCASVGCPALRPEAFVASRLDAQLEHAMQRFLADRTRNRVEGGRARVSMIFKWFREDFERGHQGFTRLEDVFARYAAALTDDPGEQARLRAKELSVDYLPYDWSLNAAGRE